MKNEPHQLDLFGATRKPCARCGHPFVFVIEGRGRPVKFCGDECRNDRRGPARPGWDAWGNRRTDLVPDGHQVAQKKAQRRAWNAAHYIPAKRQGSS
jgi:hypothetical protein